MPEREREENSGKWNGPTEQVTWQTGRLTAVD